QAGLSWITILRKREGYRKAFCDFNADQVAQMTNEDVERLMLFDGIVKNRLKIKSTITNARLFLALQEEFGSFYEYMLSFFPDRQPIDNHLNSLSGAPATSPESDAMSKDMKKRGFKFFGSTICYAHLQATGFINDHLTDCVCRKERD
ncbi:MAG: DNA-3-methyladenine glycosylase I, partial [Alistipes sp.]